MCASAANGYDTLWEAMSTAWTLLLPRWDPWERDFARQESGYASVYKPPASTRKEVLGWAACHTCSRQEYQAVRNILVLCFRPLLRQMRCQKLLSNNHAHEFRVESTTMKSQLQAKIAHLSTRLSNHTHQHLPRHNATAPSNFLLNLV